MAARKKLRPSQTKLLPQEKQHIQAVVAQAEAMQMAEEIRIGSVLPSLPTLIHVTAAHALRLALRTLKDARSVSG